MDRGCVLVFGVAGQERMNSINDASYNRLRAVSCSMAMLLMTVGLVGCSLFAARYAVKASSWWMSMLAVSVCLLVLCSWVQLLAARANSRSWVGVFARREAQTRAAEARCSVAHVYGNRMWQHPPGPAASPGQGLPPPPGPHPEGGHQTVLTPPPYHITDLPPCYGATAPAPTPAPGNAASLEEPPPPYSVAIEAEPPPVALTTPAPAPVRVV